MTKVAVIVNNIEHGGVATAVRAFYNVVLKYFSNIVLDFIVYEEPGKKTRDKYDAKGSKIIVIPAVGIHPIKYMKNIKRVLYENGPYDVVHIHTAYFIWLAAKEAKKLGIKNRIGHAHGSKGKTKSHLWNILASIGRPLNRKYCTKMFSCADKSGAWTFGKGYEFLPNVLEEKDDTPIEKEEYYKEFGVEKGAGIIGYMGVFEIEKNTEFLPRIMEEFRNDNYICIAAGDGSHLERTKQIANQLNIVRKIQFIGYRKDVNSLLKFFDVLVVPSFSEGMSLTLLEAQIAGVPCVVSAGVPKTNDLQCGLYYIVDDYDVTNWKKSIEIAKENGSKFSLFERKEILKKIGYDEETIAKALVTSYCQ